MKNVFRICFLLAWALLISACNLSALNVTPTSSPTAAPYPTETLTITLTPTFSQPFTYIVQQGETLNSIAEKFNLGRNAVALIILLNPPMYRNGSQEGIDPKTQVITPGQILFLPNPDMQLPDSPLVIASLPKGMKIEYTVRSGDTIRTIASKFNSTVDAIVRENYMTDPNVIYIGQTLIIPINLVSPTITETPSSTPRP